LLLKVRVKTVQSQSLFLPMYTSTAPADPPVVLPVMGLE
jgi:hypothetical protein